MKFIEVLVVLILIFLLARFYAGWSPEKEAEEIRGYQKTYTESKEKLEKTTEQLEKEYEKYEDVE